MVEEPIRILIVDDFEMVRSSLALFIETCDDMELAGEAADGEEAVDLCHCIHPNVVLMDLILPKMDGIQATRFIRAHYPEIRVVALTSFEEENLVDQVLKAGASKCLSKNAPIDQLANAIREAHYG